jgi:hypothetical protein
MLLNELQTELLKSDLDYILARTRCNKVPLSKGLILNAILRDGDVLLDLIEAMPAHDARWLSVPWDALRPLIERRARGDAGSARGDGGGSAMPELALG